MQNASGVYDTDLTDAEWQLLHPLLPPPAKRGRPRARSLREILNGIFSLLRSGCAGRLLPKEFGPGATVHDEDRRWRRQGIWEALNQARRRQVRQSVGKPAQPSGALLDRQTIQTGDQAWASGYDAGQKIAGRKRPVVVGPRGLLLLVLVGPAWVQDRAGARPLLQAVRRRYGRLQKIWADGGYAGTLVQWFAGRVGAERCVLEIVRRLGDRAGFYILPKRWIVARTRSWLVKSRRLARDYETLTDSSEAIISLVMIRLMLQRLTKPKK